MFLFARWMSSCYSSEILNSKNDTWWAHHLDVFNKVAYPSYIKNGTVDETKLFLDTSNILRNTLNGLP